MRTFLAFLVSLLIAAPAFADRYEFDKSHTTILFYVNHLGFSDMLGVLTDYDGHFVFDEKAPEKSSVDVTLRPRGIRTSSAKLDEHLQNADFFNTEKFPDIRFVSKSVKVTGENTADITGDLTLLGVTRPVVLKARLNKAGVHPKTQDPIAGFSGSASLKRSEFGMNYGIPMVGDDVRIEVQTEGVNTDTKKATEKKN